MSAPTTPTEPFEAPSHSRPELRRVETTFSGATLASRHQSLSDGHTIPRTPILGTRKASNTDSCWLEAGGHRGGHIFRGASAATALHSKLFQIVHDQQNVLLQQSNFCKDSDVDVIKILCNKGEYRAGLDNREVESLLDELSSPGDESCSCPRLAVLLVKLEKSPSSTYDQRASISLPLVEKLFTDFGIHSNFVGDLIGQPDYWSAVGRSKYEDGKPEQAFEFACQHPRWAQKSRYEVKGRKALQGHRAPCSVLMHHSRVKNITVYVIAASESEDWFPSLLDRIGVKDGQMRAYKDTLQALASSPFMIHAIISTIAFQQSTGYVAQVKEKLMTQIKQVNDYSDQQGKTPKIHRTRSELEDRFMLENITKELHLVSQTADSGIANAHMSIKIAERMLESHSLFMMGRERLKGPSAAFIQDTHHALEYVRNSFYCQRDWLTTYKARKDTAMNFVFNMVTQQDSATNVDISYKMSNDSSSMNAVTILTLIFLPGTFLSTLFSSVAFDTTDSGEARTTEYFIPFVITGLILTVLCWSVWYFRARLGRWRELVMLKSRKALSRAKSDSAVSMA